jgi:hypothetical protein
MRMKRILLLVLLLAGMTTGTGFNANQFVSGETAVPTAVIHHLTLDESGITFTLQTPPLQYEAQRVTIAGLTDRIETPGAPALPIYTAFIALPPTGEATVTVRATAVSQRQLNGQPVAPVPEPHLRYNPLALILDDLPAPPSRDPDDLFSLTVAPDPAIYQADAFYPARHDALSAPMMRRDVRLAQLTLYPVQYNPASGLLLQAAQLEVSVAFSGATPQVNRPSPSHQDNHINDMRDLVINFEQIAEWRSLPANLEGEPTRLPVGQETYKIEVNQDGVYELTYDMLSAAGMAVANVDPRAFEMLHRGEPVAYQFVGNPDNGFQPGEAIRFYGWASLGSRLEDQYVKNNVFWLFANGAATHIESRQPEQGHPLAENFLESLTYEENHYFNLTNTNLWSTFPNEPDAWYWLRFIKTTAAPITQTLHLTIPHPALTGADAVFTAEFFSRTNPAAAPHVMKVYLNQYPNPGFESWFGLRSLNITSTIPLADVVDGLNRFDMLMETAAAVPTQHRIELNRITIDYLRQFVAVDDSLTFSDHDGGGRSYAISGFSQSDPQQIAVWDISQPHLPERIALSAANISGGGPYVYAFGGVHDAGSRFIATAHFRQPVAITEYIPPDIDPPGGQADWVAVSYGDFITETQRLAAHRADPLFGGLATHIVDFEDLVNQYGYGLATPAAVQNYLRYALVHWQTAPSYLLLVGDGNEDPAGFGCYTCASFWDNDETRFIFPNLVFEDRWQGRIPSDEPFVFLVGDDLLADMAVGRLAAQSNGELAGMIDKIIQYEANHLAPDNYDWLANILFVNDRSDTSAGDFCSYSHQIGEHYFPDSFAKEYLCLPDNPTSGDHTDLRWAMIDSVMAGVSFLNYRGHGSVIDWGSTILSTSAAHQALWQNEAKPIVIFSLDCLDGWFSLPGQPGLGETYHGLSGGGTAAHWSSTGLGLTSEHSLLHQHLNRGIFEQGLTAIGDAIQYAKMRYHLAGAHRSMIFSFVLQGDPAMQLMRPDPHLTQQLLTAGSIDPGDEVQFRLQISNEGLYPALPTVVSALPPSLTYISAESNRPLTVITDTATVSMALTYGDAFPDKGLPYGETAVITLTLQVAPTFSGPTVLSSVVETPGLPITPGANQATTPFTVFALKLYLPFIANQP